MACAALMFVFNTIQDLVESRRISLTSSTREILQYALDEAWLEDTLRLSWCSEVVAATNEEIMMIEEARRLEDAIESAVSDQLIENSKSCNSNFSLNLDHLKPDVDSFAHMAEKMKGRIEELWEQKAVEVMEQHIMEICGLQNNDDEEEVASASSAADMVGLDDEFRRLRDIYTRPYDTAFSILGWRIISITGMAGLGKTAFAKRVYNDPMVKEKFECRAFVRVGREYWRERVMPSLNTQLNHGHEKMMEEGDGLEDILESLRTTFRDKSCLVVLDDLWDNGLLKNIFELSGSRGLEKMILVTSRQENFDYHNFRLRFLNEDESWELLRRKVFGEGEACPPILVEPGKKIAKKCGGLPLLINALAPVLHQKAGKNPKSWNKVAKKPSSLLEEACKQISEVLLTSYNQLDEIFKLCFLYIAIFPEDYVISWSTINDLWQVEGFNHFTYENSPFAKKSNVFINFIINNLIIADRKRWLDGQEIKSCILHCAYWYVNKMVARDNRFLYIMNSLADGTDEHVKTHQRLAIQTNVLLSIKEVFDNIISVSNVRSLLCTGAYNQYEVPIPCFEWKMLRILNVVTVRFYEFPVEVVTLVLLRYLALTCNGNIPPSISKLWTLQFLIVRQHWRIKRVGVESFAPVEIWDLQDLIHLEIMGRNMPEPPHPGVVLPNLIKLLGVGVESCSRGVLGNIPKLEKVRVHIELAPGAAQELPCLFDVRSFQCVVMNPTLLRPPPPLSVPTLDGIEKLSLGGFGYPWEEMSTIAKLPFLKVLKLHSYAFRGENWEVNEEMRFLNLRYLYIEDTDLVHWTCTTWKSMENMVFLTLKNCHKLRQIPGLGAYSLRSIELIDCNPLAETCAKQIHGSDGAVTATYSWKEKKSK